MEYSERALREYINKCFKDAYRAENREFNNIDDRKYSFEWVLVKNPYIDKYQFYPIAKCKYNRVVRRVLYRLNNNLEKNFNIIYMNTDTLRASFYHTGLIDPNFTQAMFVDRGGKHISLSIIDRTNNPYEYGIDSNEGVRGKVLIAYVFEKLLFTYWNIDGDIYKALSDDDERKHLPASYTKDWVGFKELYLKAFGKEIGSRYGIISSSGLQKI